jgi:Uma2 family endonuclease
MSLQPKTRYTIPEYLELEAATPQKHEYLGGEIFAMGGASEAHNLIVGNVLSGLHQQLRGKPCRVYPSDLRVKVSSTGLYTYPDVTVVCGKPELEQPGETLLNPNVLIEVLSESSEAYDRGKKFEQYRTLASLSDYLLIAQDKPLVEHYSRQSGGRWLLVAANTLAEHIEIGSIGCSLALAEVYLNVDGIARPARA